MTAVIPIAAFGAASQSRLATAGLSEETRAPLIEEMKAVSKAMGRIHTALVTGDHPTVATEARNIHDSFVLQQEFSDAHREEIGAELPPDFIKADRAFPDLRPIFLCGQIAVICGERWRRATGVRVLATG